MDSQSIENSQITKIFAKLIFTIYLGYYSFSNKKIAKQNSVYVTKKDLRRATNGVKSHVSKIDGSKANVIYLFFWPFKRVITNGSVKQYNNFTSVFAFYRSLQKELHC